LLQRGSLAHLAKDAQSAQQVAGVAKGFEGGVAFADRGKEEQLNGSSIIFIIVVVALLLLQDGGFQRVQGERQLFFNLFGRFGNGDWFLLFVVVVVVAAVRNALTLLLFGSCSR